MQPHITEKNENRYKHCNLRFVNHLKDKFGTYREILWDFFGFKFCFFFFFLGEGQRKLSEKENLRADMFKVKNGYNWKKRYPIPKLE